MNSRTDRKLLEIPLARYSYRHEAEFAAGFLDEAGIPYRLQFDDPSMGMAMGMGSTIWVRGLDEARAKEVLEHGLQPLDEDDDPFDEGGAGPGVPTSGGERARSAPPAAGEPLGGRERALLLTGSVLSGAGALFLAGATSPIVGPALMIAAVLMAMAGILGWAPEALRRFLRAISGHAP